MTPQTPLFKQVFVNGDEKNLPKETGTYIVETFTAGIKEYRFDPDEKDAPPLSLRLSSRQIWMPNVNWYLQPVEQPEKEESKEKLAEKIEHIFKNVQRIHGKSETVDWIKIASHRSAGNILGLNMTCTLGGGISDGLEPGSLNNPIQPQSPDPEKIDDHIPDVGEKIKNESLPDEIKGRWAIKKLHP